ncbi:MAG: hypothetical protein RLZZ139_4116 [Cyanobacteriota bacterium]|jgi:hypothetical protein
MTKILGSPASSFMQERLDKSRNFLREYSEIIDTYLVGLSTRLGIPFTFEIDCENGSVIFKRQLPPKGKLLGITYTFDEETLFFKEPTAELLRVSIASLRYCITKTLLKFSDQFYRDRFEGKPFVDDSLFEYTNKDGSTSLIRVDAIDWSSVFEAV